MTFSLSKLTELQSVSLSTAWIEEMTAWAKRVQKYREYDDGDHKAAYLTTEMRHLLRLEDEDDDDAFAANYCSIVKNTKVDRLEVTGITGGSKELDAWVNEVMDANRFDGLQFDVHDGAVGEGDTFVMGSWDNVTRRVVYTHEPAFDTVSGMVPLYRSRHIREMECAFKIWQVEIDANSTQTRVNVYFKDRVEHYAAVDDGKLEPYTTPGMRAVEQWTVGAARGGEAIGMPIVHFKNGGRFNTGESEFKAAIGPQNALDRIWYSLVLNTEYTGFSLLFALGFDPGGDFRPGTLVKAIMQGGEPPTTDQQVDFRRIEAGSSSEFLNAAQYIENVIGRVTRTPSPEFVAPTASGEARKQAEAGLIGKVKRTQVGFGNAWENLFTLAHRIQTAFGLDRPPALPEGKAFTCLWRNAELRNDVEVVDNVVKMQPFVDEKTTLEGFAPVMNWDSDKIQEILDNKALEKEADMNAALQQMPGFGKFDDRFQDQGDGQSVMADEMPQFDNEEEPV